MTNEHYSTTTTSVALHSIVVVALVAPTISSSCRSFLEGTWVTNVSKTSDAVSIVSSNLQNATRINLSESLSLLLLLSILLEKKGLDGMHKTPFSCANHLQNTQSNRFV